jgi:hypothetical protein
MIAHFSKHLRIALFLLFPLISQAQFPTAVGTKWEYFQFWEDNFDPQAVRDAFVDEVVGDTVAGGLTYHIVRRTGSMYNGVFTSQNFDDVSGSYYYRTAGQLVSVLDSVHLGLSYESLLYNFGLSTGDTLIEVPNNLIDLTRPAADNTILKNYHPDTACITFGMCDTNYVCADFLGSLPWWVPGKVWDPYRNITFQPGIGTLYSIPFATILDVNGQYYFLKRLTSNGQVLYIHPEFMTAVQRPVDPQLLEVFPNPASDRVHIRSTSSITNVQLIDITGRVIADIAIAASQASLDLSQYPAGIYALVAQVDGKSLSRKLVLR